MLALPGDARCSTRPPRWRRGLRGGFHQAPDLRAEPFWPLGDGEVHYAYWFMQGSIMTPEVRHALRQGWGFCERHAWGELAVEMRFRMVLLLGPVILYEDLIGRGLAAFPRFGPFRAKRLRHRLRPQAPCLMCDIGAHRAGGGAADMAMIRYGRQTDALREFALRHRTYWDPTVCGICRNNRTDTRCRRHLVESATSADSALLHDQVALLEATRRRLKAFGGSFVWGHYDTDSPEDRAALLTAVGWMSGWRPLLALVDGSGR